MSLVGAGKKPKDEHFKPRAGNDPFALTSATTAAWFAAPITAPTPNSSKRSTAGSE